MTRPLPMTRGRRAALIIGTPLALAIIGWTALTAVAWAGQGSYGVNLALGVRGRPVSVAVDSGELSISPGAAGKLRVTGTAHYALVRSQVTSRSTSSAVSVRSRCHQLTGPCSFDYAVAIPPGITAGIADASGNVTARGLANRLTLQAGSGQVQASSLSGDVQISDGSGNVSGASLTSPQLLITAGSGVIDVTGVVSQHVRIRDGSGNVSAASLASPQLLITAGSGVIDVTGLTSQDVTVTDDSGNITLAFARVPGQVRVSSGSGQVTIVLPPGRTAYRVSARTSSGTRSVDVPTSSSSPHVIDVTDQSGNITITR